VGQLRPELDFSAEALVSDGGRDLLMQDLDGDAPLIMDIVRSVDDGHATAADFFNQLVTRGKPVAKLDEIHGVGEEGATPKYYQAPYSTRGRQRRFSPRADTNPRTVRRIPGPRDLRVAGRC
jgi:hypothetical protein